MALLTPPAFVGKITITSGANDKIYWDEPAGPYTLSATITAGEYWPDDLATAIGSAMDTVSGASGASYSYEWSFGVDTGLATCTGSGSFYLKCTTSETDNILRGGDSDTLGNGLTTGQYGLNGLGWAVEVAYPLPYTDVSGAFHYAHWFTAEYPPSKNDDGQSFNSTAAQSFSLNGTPKTYDFTGWDDSAAEWPLYGGLFRTRTIEYQRVTSAYKELWISNFWGPYGKQGKTFRYYSNRTLGTYELYVLTGDSLKNHGLDNRESGYAWWSGQVSMHRVGS